MTAVSKKLAPYKADDPRYVNSPAEEVEIIKSITVDQLKGVYAELVGSSVGELTIIGDFDPQAIVPRWTSSQTAGSQTSSSNASRVSR